MINALAIIIGIIGLVGCFVPILPGPPVSWGALLLLYFAGNGKMTLTFLMVWLAITVIVTILDYVIPSYFTRITGGSKAAGRGSFIGLIVGIIFFPPWGMIVGSFLGAMLAEILINHTEVSKSIKPALGSLLGFIFSTGLKFTTSAVMMYYTFTFLS